MGAKKVFFSRSGGGYPPPLPPVHLSRPKVPSLPKNPKMLQADSFWPAKLHHGKLQAQVKPCCLGKEFSCIQVDVSFEQFNLGGDISNAFAGAPKMNESLLFPRVSSTSPLGSRRSLSFLFAGVRSLEAFHPTRRCSR